MIKFAQLTCVLLILAGCSSIKVQELPYDDTVPPPSSSNDSKYYLSDHLINKYQGDMSALYYNWPSAMENRDKLKQTERTRYNLPEEVRFSFTANEHTVDADIHALVDGYRRYCEHEKGQISIERSSKSTYLAHCNQGDDYRHSIQIQIAESAVWVDYWTKELNQKSSDGWRYELEDVTESYNGILVMQNGTTHAFTDLTARIDTYWEKSEYEGKLHLMSNPMVRLYNIYSPLVYDLPVPLRDIYQLSPMYYASTGDAYTQGYLVVTKDGVMGFTQNIGYRFDGDTYAPLRTITASTANSESITVEWDAGIETVILGDTPPTKRWTETDNDIRLMHKQSAFTERDRERKKLASRKREAEREATKAERERRRAMEEQARIEQLMNVNNIGNTVCLSGYIINSATRQQVYGTIGAYIDDINVDSRKLRVISTGRWSSAKGIWTPDGSINTLAGINVAQAGIVAWVDPKDWQLCSASSSL